MTRHLLAIERLRQQGKFLGYLVSSTAPINVEDQLEVTVEKSPDDLILEIAEYLKKQEGRAEILVLIHGYNSDKSGAEWWYNSACEYIAQNFDQQVSDGFVVIGFRWPSEKVLQISGGGIGANLKNVQQFLSDSLKSFQALPKPLAIAGKAGLVIAVLSTLLYILTTILKIISSIVLSVVSSIFFNVALIILTFILTVFVLRISGYFRDTYRAATYGVSDLVEFIRQLDNQLVERSPSENRQQNEEFWEKPENNDRRIRLHFIGHSMGAYVVTNTVRILSDVFDRSSIGKLDVENRKKLPSSNIGNVFRLGRLVLVAPDIPAEAVITGRGNPLRSSLRRFDEAYLFSNEGDMVLKLASTAANSFSFPASTRDGGYRLGNVVVRSQSSGIINLDEQGQFISLPGKAFLERLSIRDGLPLSIRQQDIGLEDDRFIAELFTYFDCTDYQENGKGIVSKALGKPFLSFWDYFRLSTSNIDGHGGYLFHGDADLTRRLIYGLSCIGFENLLKTIDSTESDKIKLLQAFSDKCKTKGIQVLLASERYQVDVLGNRRGRDRTGY